MVAVTGITGKVGGAVGDYLLGAGEKLRAVVRSERKGEGWAERGAEVAVANFHDVAALTQAFKDVEGVFIMLPPNFVPTPGFPEARAMVAALREALMKARPPQIVVLSSVGAQQACGLGIIEQLHILEQELADLPMASAFLRAAWSLENSIWDLRPAREEGEIFSYLAPLDRPFPMVATADVGCTAGRALLQQWSGQRIIEIEGPQRYSQNDIAAAMSRVLKKPVHPSPVPRQDWEKLFVEQGAGMESAFLRTEMLDGFNSGWIDFAGEGAEQVLGEVTLEEVLFSPIYE